MIGGLSLLPSSLMAFSAVTGKSVRLADGQIQTHVTVTNDANGNSFEDDLSYQPGSDLASTQKNLEARVRAAIDLAKKVASSKAVALLPVGTVLDLSVPNAVVVPPTQAELDRAAWFADYDAEVTQMRLATLSADLRSRYKAEYGGVR